MAHSKEVNAIAIAPHDKLAVSASQDRTLKVWALNERELVEAGILRGHKRAVWCCAISSADRIVASGSADMTLKLWSLSSITCVRTLEGHSASVLRVIWVHSGAHVLSSGSDGLLKVWSAKGAECVCTLDTHEDKIWALDVFVSSDNRCEIWSGSADATIVRWRDSAVHVTMEASMVREMRMEHEQSLAIALHARNFGTALKLATKLRQPRSLRAVMEEMIAARQPEATLVAALQSLSGDELALCLSCARDWNTTAQHGPFAHHLLHALFCAIPPFSLVAAPQVTEMLEGLLPYSERHLERLDRLHQDAHILPYTHATMSFMNADPDTALSTVPYRI